MGLNLLGSFGGKDGSSEPFKLQNLGTRSYSPNHVTTAAKRRLILSNKRGRNNESARTPTPVRQLACGDPRSGSRPRSGKLTELINLRKEAESAQTQSLSGQF